MASVNKVILVGNLGRDPEVRYMPSGDAVANITIATSSKYKNKAGELVEETEWHRISFFGKQAKCRCWARATIRANRNRPRASSSALQRNQHHSAQQQPERPVAALMTWTTTSRSFLRRRATT